MMDGVNDVTCKICGHSASAHRYATPEAQCSACPDRTCQDGPVGRRYRAQPLARHDDVVATYTGPAALILPDNTEVDVRAVLSSYTENRLEAWRGTLTVTGSGSMWDGLRNTCQIRTTDGRYGDVILTRFNPGPNGEVVEVTGSGAAPF